jgi:hypothetical protein
MIMKQKVLPKEPGNFWTEDDEATSGFAFFGGCAISVIILSCIQTSLVFTWIVFVIAGGLIAYYLHVSRVNSFHSKTSYIECISRAYRQSMKAAIQCDWPEGVMYILANTLKQLEMVGIDFPPSRRNYTWRDQTSEVIGYPDQSKLKNAIRLAHEISSNWDDITRLGGVSAQIQAMESVHRLIEPEDISIHGMRPDVKRVDALFAYSYTEEDYRSGLGRDLISTRSSESSPNQFSSYQKDSGPQPHPRQQELATATLTFQEFLARNPSVRDFLPPEEQHLEYHRYLQLRGASKSSEQPLSRNQVQGEPGQHAPRQERDPDVW